MLLLLFGLPLVGEELMVCLSDLMLIGLFILLPTIPLVLDGVVGLAFDGADG